MEDKKAIQEAFGQVLVSLRKEKNLKQAELAELSYMDVTYISDLERGLYMPSLHTLLKLAQGLGESFEEMAKKIEITLNRNPDSDFDDMD